MNKQLRISMIVSFAAILVVAVAVPAFAVTPPKCSFEWRGYHEKADTIWTYFADGSSTYTLADNTLTRTCEGIIPLGQSTDLPWVTAFDLDQMTDYMCTEFFPDGDCPIDANEFEVNSAVTGGRLAEIEYKGETLVTEDWYGTVDEEGNFFWEAVFTLPED